MHNIYFDLYINSKTSKKVQTKNASSLTVGGVGVAGCGAAARGDGCLDGQTQAGGGRGSGAAGALAGRHRGAAVRRPGTGAG